MPILKITDTGVTYEVPEGKILFDAVADCGLELPHGCLSGSCGACRIDVVEGVENLAPPSMIETNTIEGIKDEYARKEGPAFLEGKTIRLSCRARVMGDVEFYPLSRRKA